MTRQKKQLYGAVLGLGAIVLLIDRMSALAGSGPSESAAAVVQPTGLLTLDSVTGDLVSVAAAPFPRDIPDLAGTSPLRDVFAPTDLVRSKLSSEADGNPGREAGKPARLGPEEFAASHHLNGVMRTDSTSVAVVDGKWLRVGDSVESCELSEMEATSVKFRCATFEVELSVMPSASSDPAP